MRVARAACPPGTADLPRRDARGPIVANEEGAPLLPSCGQPGRSPWRLAVVTWRPVRENRADRQAAEAVRARLAWQDLRGLERTEPGCDFAVRSACRDRVLAGRAAERC
jgi:hypothetical protein